MSLAPSRAPDDTGLADVDLSLSSRGDRAHRFVPLLVLAIDAVGLLAALALSGPLDGGALSLLLALPVVLALSGGYRVRLTLSALDEAPRLLFRAALAFLLVTPLRPEGHVQALWQGGVVVASLVVGRAFAYGLIRWGRGAGLLREPALIIGSGRVADELAVTLERHPEYGLVPVGFISTASGEEGTLLDERHIQRIFAEYGPRRLVVAFGPTREAQLVALLRAAVEHGVVVHVVPRFFDVGMLSTGPEVDDIWGIPLYRVRPAAFERRAWRLKRVFDMVVAGGGLLLASPLLVPVALAIKRGSPGPLFFRQRRIGQHGREFAVLKFRTLRVTEEQGGEGIIDLRSHGDDLGVQARRQRDVEDRITAIGGFLRTTGLDELPQLWNVVRGDMSLIGPRPEESRFAAQFDASVEGYSDRHRLPVGLTGWAQVHGLRGETSIVERARFDNYYIEHWSIWRDVVILVRTVSAVARQVLPHRTR